MSTVAEELPIYRVTEAGDVERLGFWHHDTRALTLERDGFPLMRAGRHQVEGELPWLFWDMCPSGFLGTRLAAQNPLLGLPGDPRRWGHADALRVLQLAGSELSGNVLVGEQAVSQFREWTWSARTISSDLDLILRDVAGSAVPSSLGGERPKVIHQEQDGREALVKFSPPGDTPQGRRWSDLLITELHCSLALRLAGIDAAPSHRFTIGDRKLLSVTRFDRLPKRGRRGASTLDWLAMDRWGDVRLPAPEVTRRLVASGELPEEDAVTCDKVHAFSAAIGNDDAHLGNYGLVFDELGRARLAPIYDVLPMVFAPRHDELPDQWVQPRAAPIRDDVRPMVEHLAHLIGTDDDLSPEFKEHWLRYVGL